MIKNILCLYRHKSPEKFIFQEFVQDGYELGHKDGSECGLHRGPQMKSWGPPLKSWQDWKWTFIFILLKCLHLSPLLWKKPIQGCWMNLTCSFSKLYILPAHSTLSYYISENRYSYNFLACVIKRLLKETLYFSVWNKFSTVPSRPFFLRGLASLFLVMWVWLWFTAQSRQKKLNAGRWGLEATRVVSICASHFVSQLFILAKSTVERPQMAIAAWRW